MLNSRYFPIGACIVVALALIVASRVDSKRRLSATDTDLLPLNAINEQEPEPAVHGPSFKKIPQRIQGLYTSNGDQPDVVFNAPEPTLADPTITAPTQSGKQQSDPYESYPLIDSPILDEPQPGKESTQEMLPALQANQPVMDERYLSDAGSEGGGDFVPRKIQGQSAVHSPSRNRSFGQGHGAPGRGAGSSSETESRPWQSAVDSESSGQGRIVGVQPVPETRHEEGQSVQRPAVPSMLPRATDANRLDDSTNGNNNVQVNPVGTGGSGSGNPSPSNPSPTNPSSKEPTPAKPAQDSNSINPSNFRLAAQPKEGAVHEYHPQTDKRAWLVDPNSADFHPGPIYDGMPYDPYGQIDIYEGKTLNATQRPLLELGRPWYQLGQLPESYDFLGKHNPVSPQLIVFGDFRTAYASNNNVGESDSQIAYEWNMNWDLRFTGTERFAWFLAPLNDGEDNTRYELDNDQYVDRWNADFVFGYFEGDLGAMVGGWTGQTLPFDLPFAVGVMPLLFQNGVWLEDQFLGVATTIPARNVPKLGISNMDITFFAGYDEILSPAFENEDDVARLYGIASFIEAGNGYWEIDYAYLEDRNTARDRSYHNVGVGYSRRYGRWISNSTRIIVNAGQSTVGGPNTADGVLLLSENSLITGHPSSVIPYFNFFAGFDRPQKAAGQGVLKNTGILFESDGMTGYPTLDPTAQNTYGGAFGLNIMPPDFSQQLILETAFVGVMGDASERNAVSNQYGFGMRYQLPLNNSVILRADAMYGLLEDSEDINGVRVELRRKF